MSKMEMINKAMPRDKRMRMMALMLVDLVIACACGYLALLARFDFSPAHIEAQYLGHWLRLLPVFLVVTFGLYYFGRMYSIMWSQAGIREGIRIAGLNLAGALLMLEIYTLLQISMPRSFFPLAVIAQTIMEFAVRFSYRIMRSTLGDIAAANDAGPRTMIVGAGQAGGQLGKEIRWNISLENTLSIHLKYPTLLHLFFCQIYMKIFVPKNCHGYYAILRMSNQTPF